MLVGYLLSVSILDKSMCRLSVALVLRMSDVLTTADSFNTLIPSELTPSRQAVQSGVPGAKPIDAYGDV